MFVCHQKEYECGYTERNIDEGNLILGEREQETIHVGLDLGRKRNQYGRPMPLAELEYSREDKHPSRCGRRNEHDGIHQSEQGVRKEPGEKQVGRIKEKICERGKLDKPRQSPENPYYGTNRASLVWAVHWREFSDAGPPGRGSPSRESSWWFSLPSLSYRDGREQFSLLERFFLSAYLLGVIKDNHLQPVRSIEPLVLPNGPIRNQGEEK